MNLPEKFTERMKTMLGNEYDEFAAAFENAPVYSGIRVNTLKNNAKNIVLSEFGELEKIPWCENGFYADKSVISGSHPFHLAGLFYFQEPSAMSAVEGLPIEKGDFVLDLCAAPGGKSTQAAAKLGGAGLLVSNEIIKKRADILSENIERMGIRNAVVTNETPQRLAEKYPKFFDKIIVDAPCSGEGMFRKEPQAITEWSVEHTLSCAARQKNILDSAVKMLKDGGMLIYSTCTFAPEENEQIAAYLIKNHGLELAEPKNLFMLENGRSEWSDSNCDMTKTRRIFPHKQNGEGHFIALFKKSGESGGRVFENLKLNQAEKEAVKIYKDFEKQYLNIELDGGFCLFGERLYLKPVGVDIDKIKVIRCGLLLGECRKNRFEPSHALALALEKSDFKNCINLELTSGDLKKYLHGDVISCDKSGWCAVLAEGYPMGWGKASGGVLKNHFPKKFRINI